MLKLRKFVQLQYCTGKDQIKSKEEYVAIRQFNQQTYSFMASSCKSLFFKIFLTMFELFRKKLVCSQTNKQEKSLKQACIFANFCTGFQRF